MTALYAAAVGRLLRAQRRVLAVYGGLLVLTYFGFNYTPKGFIEPGQGLLAGQCSIARFGVGATGPTS